MRPAELHSRSAEENCSTENVSSLRSVKVATPPCAAKAAIPCGLAVRKQHKMLFAASKLQKSMMEVLNLKRAAKIVLIGVCFGLILLFLKISFRIDDAAFMHGYWIAAVEITPSRVPTVAIVIPEVSTDTVTLETVSTILSFLLSVCLFSLYRSVNRIA